MRETLDDPGVRVEHPGGQVWAVRGNDHSVLATSTWGTSRYPAAALAQAILEQRKIEVRDLVKTLDGERRVLNLDATLAAQEKAGELAERFSAWAWEDPGRARELASCYNERFNNLALRSYDHAELSLPGLSVTFKPRPHQVAAVARMIGEPAVLLAHEVGAGKTAETIIGVTELRRLGLIRKPAVVVPNHMLEREWLVQYPYPAQPARSKRRAVTAQQHLRHRQAHQLGVGDVRRPARAAAGKPPRGDNAVGQLHVPCGQESVQVGDHGWAPRSGRV